MYCTILMIDSFLKTVNLVLVDDINVLYDQSHASTETTDGVRKQNVPIVDPDAVLISQEALVVVQEGWDRNSTIYGGSESAQSHVRVV